MLPFKRGVLPLNRRKLELQTPQWRGDMTLTSEVTTGVKEGLWGPQAQEISRVSNGLVAFVSSTNTGTTTQHFFGRGATAPGAPCLAWLVAEAAELG